MKKLILPLALLSSAAMAGPYSVQFESPMKLKFDTLVNVAKVSKKLNRETNAWAQTSRTEKVATCGVDINIKGRDIATKNRKIGEHYYGDMMLNCTASFSKPFKAKFSRVLFTGIRQCVQSETVIDNDYCQIGVVAFRKKTDKSLANGDILKKSSKKIQYYHIGNATSDKIVKRLGLMPRGLNPSLVESSQIFKVNIGINADSFFVENHASNFSKGEIIPLELDGDAISRDEALKDLISEEAFKISDELSKITTEEMFKASLFKTLPKLSQMIKKSLEIIAPVNYLAAENQIKELEGFLINMGKKFNPNVTSRSTFMSSYASGSLGLSRLLNYVGRNYNGSNILGNSSNDSSTGTVTGGDFSEGGFQLNMENLKVILSFRSHSMRLKNLREFINTNIRSFNYKTLYDVRSMIRNRSSGHYHDILINYMVEKVYLTHYQRMSQSHVYKLVNMLIDPDDNGHEWEDEKVGDRIIKHWAQHRGVIAESNIQNGSPIVPMF